MSSWKKVVEQHQGSPQNQGRKHVWEEGRLPRPIGGGVQVFVHRSDFNQRHNFHLLSKRTREGGGEVIDQELHLGYQNDREGGVQCLERMGEQTGWKSQVPNLLKPVQGKVNPKHHQGQSDQASLHPSPDFGVQNGLRKAFESRGDHVRTTL